MTVEKIEEKLEYEQLALQELIANTYDEEITAEVEAYREEVKAKYAAIKDTEKTKLEARITLLEELKSEVESEEERKVNAAEKLANDAVSAIHISTEVKSGV